MAVEDHAQRWGLGNFAKSEDVDLDCVAVGSASCGIMEFLKFSEILRTAKSVTAKHKRNERKWQIFRK